MAIPTGDIYLFSNVPLTASYEHTIDFKDKDEQFEYFKTFLKNSLTDYSYIRREREYISVGLPLIYLEDVNYIAFRSVENERFYYAFVTGVKYNNEESTDIFFSVDVMQTYQFDYEWKPSYIQQSHVDRWTADLKPIYSKTDEGLDYGTEYSVESAFRIEQSSKLQWLLVSATDLKSYMTSEVPPEYDTVQDSIPSTFNSLLVPVIIDNPTAERYNVYLGDPADPSERLFDYDDLVYLMKKTNIGDHIKNITLLSYCPFISSERVEEEEKRIIVDFNSLIFLFTVGMKMPEEYSTDLLSRVLFVSRVQQNAFNGNKLLAVTEWDTGLKSSLPTAEQWAEIKNNPYTTKRDKRFESKLLCAPYRYNILTDWRVSPVIFKNEYMTPDQIAINFSFCLSYNAPFRYWIANYKNDPEGRYTCLAQPTGLEFPIIADEYYRYMLENKNTIQANLTNAIIGNVANAINGGISGGGIGGVKGAMFGAISGGISGALNIASHIRSENAKQQDLKTRPDNIINSNDSTFNILDKNNVITFYRMRICCENEEIISEIFNISGYKVNRIDIPNTKSRTRFNYLQTMGANIIGSFNQLDLMKIKQIYDNGITIWHYNKDNFNFLDYSYENLERNLL